MSENAYESPATPPASRHAIGPLVLLPAVPLLILTIVTILFETTLAYTLVIDTRRFIEHYGVIDGSIRVAPTVIAFGLVFMAHWVVVAGSFAMCGLRRYRLALVAAFISLAPVLTPGYVIGIPFGIWALIALRRPDVKHAFLDK